MHKIMPISGERSGSVAAQAIVGVEIEMPKECPSRSVFSSPESNKRLLEHQSINISYRLLFHTNIQCVAVSFRV